MPTHNQFVKVERYTFRETSSLHEVRLTDFIYKCSNLSDSLVELRLSILKVVRITLVAIVCAFSILALKIRGCQIHMIKRKHYITERR